MINQTDVYKKGSCKEILGSKTEDENKNILTIKIKY